MRVEIIPVSVLLPLLLLCLGRYSLKSGRIFIRASFCSYYSGEVNTHTHTHASLVDRFLNLIPRQPWNNEFLGEVCVLLNQIPTRIGILPVNKYSPLIPVNLHKSSGDLINHLVTYWLKYLLEVVLGNVFLLNIQSSLNKKMKGLPSWGFCFNGLYSRVYDWDALCPSCFRSEISTSSVLCVVSVFVIDGTYHLLGTIS